MEGLAMIVSPHDALPSGKRFLALDKSSIERFGFRSAIVKRTEHRGSHGRMLFAEIEA